MHLSHAKWENMDVKGKHVLVFGLGLLGGGLATTKWLLKHGAILRITDTKTKEQLRTTLAQLKDLPNISLALGGHRNEDIDWAEIVIVNPGVPANSPYLEYARKRKKLLVNDAALFMMNVKRPVIAVTGTRGKTTTTAWIAELLSHGTRGRRISPCGNTPENPLLREIGKRVPSNTPVVAELSSWQLEFLPVSKRAPEIAVITNLYPDHLNRYDGIDAYADAKANIFLHQHADDTLIVNADHAWTPYFMKKKPVARICWVTLRTLPRTKDGVELRNGSSWMKIGTKKRRLVAIERFRQQFGEHNLMNLLQAIAAIATYDPKRTFSEKDILSLTPPRWRQEIISQTKSLTIVNDTTATSPDGTIAALKRFSRMGNVVLIAGGTDKQLEFDAMAHALRRMLPCENLILLDGSATKRLITALEVKNSKKPIFKAIKSTLGECFDAALLRAKELPGHTTILFSPGAASFEKFKNEFDRGKQFDLLVKRAMRRKKG